MGTRVSLLGKFNGLSLLSMIVLALVIGTVLQARIETRALRGAEQLTNAIGQLTVAPRLTREQLALPLSPQKIAELDRALASVESTDAHFSHVELFASDGRIAYTEDHARIGEPGGSEDFRRALGGTIVSKVERESTTAGGRSTPSSRSTPRCD